MALRANYSCVMNNYLNYKVHGGIGCDVAWPCCRTGFVECIVAIIKVGYWIISRYLCSSCRVDLTGRAPRKRQLATQSIKLH